MVLRRELLPILLAAALLLLGPSQALAAPTWLDAEPLSDDFVAFVAPTVATDSDGNSIAVWIDQSDIQGAVLATYRPRGGAWETTTVDLEPDFPVLTGVAPRAVAAPNGSFVVVWDADRTANGDTVLRSATRSPSGAWTTEEVRDLDTTGPNFLEASTNGSVTVVAPGVSGSSSNTKTSTGAAWAGRRPSASARSMRSRPRRMAAPWRSARASAPRSRASGRASGRPAGCGAVRRRWPSPAAGP